MTWRGVGCLYMVQFKVNCKKGVSTDIMTQVPSIWTKGYILENFAYLIWQNL